MGQLQQLGHSFSGYRSVAAEEVQKVFAYVLETVEGYQRLLDVVVTLDRGLWLEPGGLDHGLVKELTLHHVLEV